MLSVAEDYTPYKTDSKVWCPIEGEFTHTLDKLEREIECISGEGFLREEEELCRGKSFKNRHTKNKYIAKKLYLEFLIEHLHKYIDSINLTNKIVEDPLFHTPLQYTPLRYILYQLNYNKSIGIPKARKLKQYIEEEEAECK